MLEVIGPGLAHVAVVSVLPPARLIGVNHRTAPDPCHNVGRRHLGPLIHPLGGRHAGASEAVGTTLARFPGLVWLAVSLGLQTGHPGRTVGFGPPLQLGNPLFQALDDRLLPDDQVPLLDDQGDQGVPVGSPELDSRFHTRYMT